MADDSFFIPFEQEGHPEGAYHELTDYDNEVWDLRTYVRCLENWDVMNECMELASKEFTNDYNKEKFRLRLGGLNILKDVDNCG